MDANQLRSAGFTDAEISEYSKLSDAGFSNDEIIQHLSESKTNDSGNKSSSTRLMFEGAKKGILDIIHGLEQRGNEMGLTGHGASNYPDNPQTGPQIQQDIASANEQYGPAMNTTPGKIGNLVAQTAILAPLPGGVEGGGLTRLATSALAGGIVGAVQPTNEGENPMGNIGTGAALGAGMSGLLTGAGKVINAASTPIKNAVQSAADKVGIRTTLGEITNNPLIQKAETWLEQIPVIGLKRFREKQNEETYTVAKKFLAGYMIDPSLSFGSPEAIAANRSYSGSLFEGMKGVVDSAKATESASKWHTIPDLQNNGILPTNTRSVAQGLVKRYPDIFKKFQDTKTEGLLQNIISDSAPMPSIYKPDPPTSTFKKLYMNEPPNGLPNMQEKIPLKVSFEDLWSLREGVGDMIGQARKKFESGEINKTQLSQMKALYASVNSDIDGWISSIGRKDVRTAINAANESYKKYVDKYDALDRTTAIMQKDMSQGKPFSPQKFANALTSISSKNKYNERFTQAEISEMTGLANIMHTVQRSGQYMENPPTGNRWGLPVAALEAAGYMLKGTPGGIATGTGIVGATGIARFLTGTEAGKRLALSASKINPDNTAMQKIMTQVYRLSAKGSAIYGTTNSQ